MAALMNGMSDTSSAVIVRYDSTPAADAAAKDLARRSADPHLPGRLGLVQRIPQPREGVAQPLLAHHEHRPVGRGPRNARGLGDDLDRHDLLLDLQLDRDRPLSVRHHDGEPVA